MAYQATVLPENGIKIKREEKNDDGTYTFRVYEVQVGVVGEFKGQPFSGRRIYRTADGQVFSTVEAAAAHVVDESEGTVFA